jgi:hypothetical protein
VEGDAAFSGREAPLGEIRVVFASRSIASPAVPVEFLSEGQVARFGRFVA